MFDPARRPASLLAIGDAVRFRPISPAEFHAARAAINAPSPPAPP
jgi:allophanate hydrolase subunit 1